MPKQVSLSKKKNLMPTVIHLNDEQFGTFLDQNRNHTHKDSTLVVNEAYCRNLFSGKFKGKASAHVKLPSANLVVFEMVTNYLLLDKLVVPLEMGVGSWIELYEMA